MTAIILLKAARQRIRDVAVALAERPEISEVFSVSGSFDLVAIARVASNDALADLVTQHLAEVEGITETETMLAFRAYSRHDLERMVSVEHDASG